MENAPRNTAENLSNQQVDHCLRREKNCRKTNDQAETAHDRVSVPNRLADPSIEEQPNDLANNNAIRQARLPRGRNLVGAVRELLAVLSFERREAEEVVQETDIVSFHTDTRADQHRPSNGFRVQLDALPEGHAVLFVGGKPRIVENLV